MLLDIEQRNDSLLVSYYTPEGKVDYKNYSIPKYYNWSVTEPDDQRKDSKFKNWDGRPVKKKGARNFNKHTLSLFLEQLPKADTDLIFGYNLPQINFFDIEVKVDKEAGFPHADLAEQPILTISLVTPDRKVIVFGLEELDSYHNDEISNNISEYFKEFDQDWKFIYKKFESEYDLVYTFVTRIIPKLPMLSGWNSLRFDWLYIVTRCKRLGIPIEKSSPTGCVDPKTKIPKHVGMIDYMDLYQNWDRSVSPKENAKLETAAQAVLKKGKIPYNGDLQRLYEEDFKTYVYYNAVDSILVYYIDQKLKTMQIVLTLANICKISIYKAGSPVAITENLLIRNFLEKDKVVCKEWDDTENKDTQYTGAYVKEPHRGKYRGVSCFDFASLYPSLMRQFNISPDSYVKQVNPEDREKHVTESNIVTKSGAVYEKSLSILREILSDLYQQRKDYKKRSWLFKTRVDEIEKKLAAQN